jgi:sensor histidine kinase YesM
VDGGQILLRSTRQDGRLVLEVEDNGVGIPEGVVAQIVKKEPGGQRNGGPGIGISNVRERLRVLYGSDFTFQIERPPGGGTSIRMGIPLFSS